MASFYALTVINGPKSGMHTLVLASGEGEGLSISFSSNHIQHKQKFSLITFHNVVLTSEELMLRVDIIQQTTAHVNLSRELDGHALAFWAFPLGEWILFERCVAKITEEEKITNALLQTESIRRSLLKGDKDDLIAAAMMLLSNIRTFAPCAEN